MLILLPILVFAAQKSAVPGHQDFRKELAELEAIKSKGVQSPDLYYNIGVCQARLNQESEAILSFLRCLNLNSAHKPARANLEYLISLSNDSQLYPQRQFISSQMLDLYDWFSINRSSLAVLILLLLSVACMHWLLHHHQDREKGLPILLLIVCGVLLLSFNSLLITKVYRMNHNRKAVIVQGSVIMRAEQQPESRSIRTLHRSLIVQVAQQEGDWARIILPNGNSGWVKSSDLERVSK